MRLCARLFVSCGTSGQVVTTSVGCGRGWVNKPGSVSVRIPRSARRVPALMALTERWAAFHAAITGSTSAHRSSLTSLL